MKTELFTKWLNETRNYKKNVVQSRMSNCNTIEQHYLDLDNHYTKDKGQHLHLLLTYSKNDEREDKPTKHGIPINGNLREGSATLKHAAKLYMEFRKQESLTK